MLKALREDGQARLWNSTALVGSRRVSEAELRTLARIPGGDLISKLNIDGGRDVDRIAAGLLATTGISFTLASQAVSLPGPESLRFALVWLLTFTPYIFLSLGLALPGSLQTGLIQVQRLALPTYRDRLLRHEAGHFLVGYLIGLPVRSYSANAVANAVQFWPLADSNAGKRRAAQLGFDVAPETSSDFGRPAELSPERRADEIKRSWAEGELQRQVQSATMVAAEAPELDPRRAWPFPKGLDHDSVDRLAVVSLAGVMAELIEYGTGEGGFADLSQLQNILDVSNPPMTDDEQQNRVRWASVMAITTLRNHQGALEALVEAMEAGAPVGECIRAIEECPDAQGVTAEFAAKQAARRGDGPGWLERILLGPSRQELEEREQKRRRRVAGSRGGESEEDGRGEGGALLSEDEVLPLAAMSTLGFLFLVLTGGIRI